MDDLFGQYVISRGYVDPKHDPEKDILDNDALLGAVAGLWRGSKEPLEAVIRARIHAIQSELIKEATPYEVPILRQAMIEVAFIMDDVEKYAREYERRKKEDPTLNGNGEGASPPVAQPDNTADSGTGSAM